MSQKNHKQKLKIKKGEKNICPNIANTHTHTHTSKKLQKQSRFHRKVDNGCEQKFTKRNWVKKHTKNLTFTGSNYRMP